MSAPRHIKTFDSLVGPFDWSLPHDEGCPGCEIEALRARVEALTEALRRISGSYDASSVKSDIARAALAAAVVPVEKQP